MSHQHILAFIILALYVSWARGLAERFIPSRKLQTNGGAGPPRPSAGSKRPDRPSLRGERAAPRGFSDRGKMTIGKPYAPIGTARINRTPVGAGDDAAAVLESKRGVAPKHSPRSESPKDTALVSAERLMAEERVQKIIARAGIASRREAQQMISDGRVRINGKIILETGAKANPRKDKIQLDDKLVSLPDQKEIYWIALNKPKDVITTMKDEKGRETVLNYIPKANELRLVPVGRMDRDSSGILICTNEVGWIHPLTHLSFQNTRRYQITVRGTPSMEGLERLRTGRLVSKVTQNLIPTCPCAVSDFDRTTQTCVLDITLTGMSSAMLSDISESIGCELVSTKRTAFGPIELKGLKKGDWRELSKAEIMKLKDSCKKSTIPIIDSDGEERPY